MTSVAAAVVMSLEDRGVSRVYGLIGTSILDFIDSLADSKKIRYVSTRHDQAAVSMAVAEGKLTGKPGIAAIHGGPGFLNALTAIAVAYKDSIPMIMISGAVKRRMSGLDSWLEVPQREMIDPIVKRSFRLDRPLETFNVISEAYFEASTPPFGPVFIEVPEDVWSQDTLGGFSTTAPAQSIAPSVSDVEKIATLIELSSRPLILAGGGINTPEGGRVLREFVERTGIPVATTGNGRGALAEDHYLSLGRCGFGGGNIVADSALKECDLLLAIGAGLSDVSSYGYNYIPKGEIVVVNMDRIEKKPVPYSISVKTDAHGFLKLLLNQSPLKSKPREDWQSFLNVKREEWNSALAEAGSRKVANHVNPARFFKLLDASLPRDAIITAGQGMHLLYAHSFVKVRSPASFLASTNLGAMGYAFPAALGAKAACPERQVYCIIGDGEFLMSISDLETAAREKLAVNIIIVNDDSYRVLLMRQKIQKMGKIFGTLLTNPDIETLGLAYGIRAMSIDDDSKVQQAVSFLQRECDGPCLLELKISREDIPPLNLEASLKF
ncbi:MAG: thiamine pyrophosphate-binding protein [Nitrososphaerales archaeon]